jgi:hypothetical protein
MSNPIDTAARSGKYMQRTEEYDRKNSGRTTDKIAQQIGNKYEPTVNVAQRAIESAQEQLQKSGNESFYKEALQRRINDEQKVIDDAERQARWDAEYSAKTEYENNVRSYENEGYSTADAEYKSGKKEDCAIM